MAVSREQGVHGRSAPPTGGSVFQPSDFSWAGLFIRAPRQIVTPDGLLQIDSSDTTGLNELLGPHSPEYFGRLSVESFFVNKGQVNGRLMVAVNIPTDAVQAEKTINDQADPTPGPTLTGKSAWRNYAEESYDGNNTGFTLTNGVRAETTATAVAVPTAVELTLASVAQLRVGELLKIYSAEPHYAKVSAINFAEKKVTVSALTLAVAIDDVVEAMGFQIKIYRKDSRGVENEVQRQEHQIWCSLEPENAEFYVENVFRNHPYISWEDEGSAEPLDKSWPLDVAVVTYLTGGLQGTAPTDADWKIDHAKFLGERGIKKRVRWIANPESNTETANQDGMTAFNGTEEQPIWICNVPRLATKAEYIDYGTRLQRGDLIFGCAVGSTRPVADPIGAGANPVREIPLVAAKIGAWIRTIYTLGFQWAATGRHVPFLGFASSENEHPDDLYTDLDLTEMKDAGINIVQRVAGAGLVCQSARAMSTDVKSQYEHYLLLINFWKVSARDSAVTEIGKPLTLEDVIALAGSVTSFALKTDEAGFPFDVQKNREFFATRDEAGNVLTFEEKFFARADASNNPQSSINAGNGNIDIKFRPPGITESLFFTVGLDFGS